FASLWLSCTTRRITLSLHDAFPISPTKASREHRIWTSRDGVLHVSGGKYTTYRAMSEEAVDLIAKEIDPRLARIHETARTPVGGDRKSRRLNSRHGSM